VALRVVEEIEEAVDGLRHDAERAVQAAAGALGRYVGDHAGAAFAQLRRHHPIVSTHAFAVVSRAPDVREVLDDFEHFTVALYAPKMEAITGPFILGLDDTPLYRHDHAALRAAVRPDDLPRLEALVYDAARERVPAAGGRIDVVAELADPVVDHAIAEYFGSSGPDTATQLRWARSLFDDIFINVSNSERTHERALAAAAEMRPHVDALVAARRAQVDAGEDVPDDVLTRLVRGAGGDDRLDDIAIRHNLIGLIAGWIPTVSKAFALAVEELLGRPGELAGAQRAAREGDRARVAAYVFEAMRFRPQNWGLLRKCAADRTIAAGTERETKIRAGATVVCGTLSAMQDEADVAAPDEFRLDRPWSDYMHFGHGLHTCFGEAMNRVQLPALAAALLERGDVSRAPGDAGRLRWDGPFPSGLTVELANR
jgi:cytochrome P450